MKLGSDDAIITVATDGADLYETELEKQKKILQVFMMKLLVRRYMDSI